MHRLLLTLTSSALAAALLLAPRPSAACSGIAFQGFRAPENGATYPANALVFAGGGAVDVTATIDGVPATATLVEELSGEIAPLSFARAFRLDPQPQPGQTVIVVSKAGYEGGEEEVVEYVAGPEDVTAPAPVSDLSLDAHSFGLTTPNGASCNGPEDAQLWVRYGVETAAAEEAPVLAWVELVKPTAAMGSTLRRLVMVPGDGVRFSDTFGDADLAGACVRVTAVDLANNAAEPVEVCGACRLREDSTGVDAESAPEEPAWTAEDYLADGPCGEMYVGEDEEGAGCGCSTRSRPLPSLLFASLLAPLALLARRRRRR